jgi:hypothetical protein
VDIDPHLEDRIKWEKEKAERRKLWEEQKKAEDEERERKEKQGRMEAFLRSRGQSFYDHTGQLPPTYVMEEWQADYVGKIAAEEERERGQRLAQDEDIAGGY